MSRSERYQGMMKGIHRFLVFFLLISFVITCCIMLFIYTMSRSMGITLTEEYIGAAARITFANVLLLSLIVTVVDGIRRKITVTRPAKQIIRAAERMMQGDFDARITFSDHEADHEFREIAACFNKMAEELSHTETLRSDFIANVSHELKTPLAVMQNYGTLLQQPNLSEEKRQEYAKAVVLSAKRLASLISNILKLNKLENQQLTPHFEEYDLSEQVCECFLGFEEQWEKKGLEIETQIEDGITVRSDPEMMSLVWNNLFSNAIKFTERGGMVSLAIFTEGEDAVVCIRDTGCGISQEVGARMFDKFYQGDTSHATEGNGLGLALVKRVVALTGSDIAVESKVGKGTAFTVRMRRGIG